MRRSRSAARRILKPLPALVFILAVAVAIAAPARAEVVQGGGIRVAVNARLEPRSLPRRGTVPVTVDFASTFSATDASSGLPPQLEGVSIAINANGSVRLGAVPRCSFARIVGSTEDGALTACHKSLVGDGHLSAKVSLPQQAPLPSRGHLLAFDGTYHGRPALLAHVYGLQPFATTTVLPFAITRRAGTFGTVLTASLPPSTDAWGYVTEISMSLGDRSGFLVAGCPAPAGFDRAPFPLARATFRFSGGIVLSSVLNRSCRVG